MSQYSNLDWQFPGLSDAGAYQISGVPYATASFTVPTLAAGALKIQFPYVTKFVTITNTVAGASRTLRVGFSQNGISGSGTNYFLLDNGESYTGEWRIEDLYIVSNSTTIQASASIIAGLTNVPRGIPPAPGVSSGNNWSGSVGVG